MKPKHWGIIDSTDEYTIQRTYPDGTDVILSVRKVGDSFELWSRSECRTSGANEHLDANLETLKEAINSANEEAQDWDNDLL